MFNPSIQSFLCLATTTLIFLFSPLQSLEILHQSPSENLGYGNFDVNTNGEALLLNHIVKPDSIVFDVGASRGNWTAMVLGIYPQISLYAFEPIPVIFHALAARVEALKNVEAYNCAMSNEVGSSEFYHYASSYTNSELSGLYRREILQNQLPEPEVMTIPLETVDHFCSTRGIKKIDVLKIDAEGAEWKILCGAKGMLKNHQIRALQFEYGSTYLDAKTMLYQMMRLLTKNNYVIFRIVPTGLVHISEWNPKLENFDYSNYFAVCLEDMPEYGLVKFAAP